MNVDYFREALELAAHGGGAMLNSEQSALIEHSLTLLQSENQFPCIFFWGKIVAEKNDYYIAFGYTKDMLRGRRFFFSVNLVQWYLLPPANPEQFITCFLAPNTMTGNIAEIHEVEMDPKFITQPGGEILPAKREVRVLKEEDWLACIVTQITEEAALMPRGALHKRMDGKIVYAPEFKGLRALEATKLDNYVLYRTPVKAWNSNLLKKPDYNYASDIFDTTDCIVPSGRAFALSISSNVILIRSLYWPGMLFFNKRGSRKHGFCYFGNGHKNMDLLFML